MSAPSSPPAPGFPLSWGVALAAASLLLIGGGTVIWSGQPEQAPVTPPTPALVLSEARALPVPTSDVPTPAAAFSDAGLHTVSYTVENGARIVKIKVVATGDELVIDAVTGRFIEARPGRPTAPPPMGKFAAPFDPTT